MAPFGSTKVPLVHFTDLEEQTDSGSSSAPFNLILWHQAPDQHNQTLWQFQSKNFNEVCESKMLVLETAR